MLIEKKNLYKQAHTFRCVHEAHRHFNSEMSPFHILSKKNCFPHGCVYFHWQCRLLAKQKKCFRGFTTVGRECFNCKYFYEEKQHQYPQFIENGQNQDTFMQAFEEFEEWINELQNKRINVEGTVAAVTPELSLKYSGRQLQLQMNGFVVRFDQGFIDNQLFADPFYLSISAMSQNKLQLRENDELEFDAGLLIDRGRFKFIRPGRFQFYQRGENRALRRNDVLVALRTYSIQKNQPLKCMRCAYGQLVDAENRKNGPSRLTVCLQGIADYRYCTISMESFENSNGDSCINNSWVKMNCNHVL